MNDVDKDDDDDHVEVTSTTDASLKKGNSYDKEIGNSMPSFELGGNGWHPSTINTEDAVTAKETPARLMDNAIILSRASDEALNDNSKPRGDATSGPEIIHHSHKRDLM